MSSEIQQLLKEVLSLPPSERAAFAERLLISLDPPDSSLDELWATEAEDRIQAYEEGKIKAVLAEEVFAEFKGA